MRKANCTVSKIRFAIVAFVSLALSPLRTESQSAIRVGYAVMTADAESTVPVASALFTYTNGDALVSQAAVGAVEPARNLRIFVDEVATQTGVALVNASPTPASVTLTLRNAAGREETQPRSLTIGGNQHLARFVSEWFGARQGFTGTLTIQSDQPLAATTLRQSYNSRGETLYAALPVVNMDVPNIPVTVFPHIAAGNGWLTQLLLINVAPTTSSGQARLYASDGRP